MRADPEWRVCPKCFQMAGQKLDTSVSVSADLYECQQCGHVWQLPRTSPKPR